MNKLIYALPLLIFWVFLLITPVQSLAEASQQLTCKDVAGKVKNGAFLVDVRTKEEFTSGSLSGSINVPYDQIELNLNQFPSNKKREIILYCKSGRRSELGKQTLAKLGYINVVNAGSYDELLRCWSNK